MSVEIREVQGKKALKQFITFPEQLYKGDKLWYPSLHSDEIATLHPDKNPAFKYCEAAYFLAYKEDQIVGRVAAIINHNANKDWKENTVRFGWIDFVDDYEVSAALIKKVADWGAARGMVKIKGPLGFTDMDKEGMLVEGFENLPSSTCIYNYPYYVEHMERIGLTKDIDWTQKIVTVPQTMPERYLKYEKIVQQRYGLHIFKPKNNSEIKKRGREIFNVLNNAFVPLYEFTRLSDEQIDCYINQYLPFVDKDLVCLVLNAEDQIVGFAITIPSLSKAYQKTKGKLFPFGFIHLLKALKKNDLLEALMVGVLPEYQGKGANALMFNHIFAGANKYGMKHMICNPQLEDNYKVLSIFDNFEFEMYMRRRSYHGEVSAMV